MDPVSVAASIVGILATAGKVIELVRPLTTSSTTISQLAAQVYRESDSIRIVLTSLKAILEDLEVVPGGPANSRACYVQIDSLIVLFTEGTLLFTQLESMLQPLRMRMSDYGNVQWLVRQRLLWVKKRSKLVLVISRMQHFLTSLSALLNIFQCRNDMAATEYQARLEAQMAALLQSNDVLTLKVRNLEDAFNAKCLIASTATSGISTPLVSTSLSHTVPSLAHLQQQLEESRVYRRVRRVESLASFGTTCTGPRAWSVFSGLSLAEISTISVIALPLYQDDLHCAKDYKRYEKERAGSLKICSADTTGEEQMTMAKQTRSKFFREAMFLDTAKFYVLHSSLCDLVL